MSAENPEYFEKSGKKPAEEKPLKSKVICAWCEKEMGEIEGIKGGEPSHGICGGCQKKYFPGAEKKRE